VTVNNPFQRGNPGLVENIWYVLRESKTKY
jgi:hypothetical protein